MSAIVSAGENSRGCGTRLPLSVRIIGERETGGGGGGEGESESGKAGGEGEVDSLIDGR
jgi:hypothetical protein